MLTSHAGESHRPRVQSARPMRTYCQQSAKEPTVIQMRPTRLRESVLALAKALKPGVVRMLENPDIVFTRPSACYGGVRRVRR